MCKITLIASRHENLGKCNSDELHRILEFLNPEVIFEEIPPIFFDEFYALKTRNTLESCAIAKFAQNHIIKQVPVDSNDVPSDDFFNNYSKLDRKVGGMANQIGFTFRNAIDNSRDQIFDKGFIYLNSQVCTNHLQEINDLRITGLKIINAQEHFQTLNLWNEINDKRENVMLDNIYKFSQNYKYNKAVFVIGYAHRESIMAKIPNYQKQYDVQLNWEVL